MKSNDEMISVWVSNDANETLMAYWTHTAPIVGESILYDRLHWEIHHIAHVVSMSAGREDTVIAYVHEYQPPVEIE